MAWFETSLQALALDLRRFYVLPDNTDRGAVKQTFQYIAEKLYIIWVREYCIAIWLLIHDQTTHHKKVNNCHIMRIMVTRPPVEAGVNRRSASRWRIMVSP